MEVSRNQVRVTVQTCNADYPCNGDDNLRWFVDVSVDNSLVARNIEVSDPLTSEAQVTSRWYLERYLQQNPYEAVESQKALRFLKGYAVKILEHLSLRSLVEAQINAHMSKGQHLELLIEVIDSETSAHTIHQIFWELLEDPQLFSPEVQTVTVVRSFQSAEDRTQPQEIVFKPQDSTINILLVVARDTNRDSALYGDISPFLATDILLGIKRDLERNQRRAHINIEIVRPGTLKAFEDHLGASERKHGPGYFHVVHFDLHGRVGTRSGALEKKNHAFLYFSHPTEERTKPERVQKIAAILQRYQVPLVVLNACESARAGAGDDANIAKAFCKGFTQKVVAMSFKISSSAASMFLRDFYASLLVGGLSFSASASRARALLRTSPERSARFGLRKPLMDWFVPVVYAAATVSVPQKDIPVQPRIGLSLIGRDFDVLRFERSLIQNRHLYLYGPRGSGKSSFVQYVSSLWQETSRVEAIVYFDMAKERIESLTDLIRLLIRKLSENLLRTGSKFAVSSRLLDIWSSDRAGLVGIFLDILKKVSTFLIFDGLNISHSDCSKDAMSRSARTLFNHFVKILLEFVRTCSQDEPIYVVLVGCRTPAWAQKKLGCDFSDRAFDLPGLQLADGIEMFQTIHGNSQTASGEMNSHDKDSLELIMNLFQGLPGALKLLEGVRVPLDILYDQLRSMPLKHGAIDIQSGPHLPVQEISDLVGNLPDYYQPLVSLLGSFWYEGGPAYVVAALFPSYMRSHVNSEPPPQEISSTCTRIVHCLQDLGYLDEYDNPLGRDGPTSIHPMLSIYSRLSHQHRHEDSAPIVSGNLKTEYVGRTSDLVQGNEWLQNFTVSAAANVQLLHRFQEGRIEGQKESAHLYELVMKNFPNMLNCMDICSSEGKILPLELWPLDIFRKMGDIVMEAASVVEVRLFLQRFELLVDAFFKFLGSLEVPTEYQYFNSFARSFLVAGHASQGLPASEVKKIVDRGIEVLKATESKYGLSSDGGVLYYSGSLYFVDTILNVELGAPQQARSSWQEALKLMALSAEDETGTSTTDTSKADIEVIDMIGSLKISLRDDKAIRSIQGYTDGPSKNMYEMMSSLAPHMEDVISEMEKSLEPERSLLTTFAEGPDRQMLQVMSQMSSYIDHAREAQGLSRQTPRLFQNLLTTNSEDMFGRTNMLSRLERLETSTDIGDLKDVEQQHWFFMVSGLINMDIEQMKSHIDALLEIYSRSPESCDQLQKMQKFKDFFVDQLPESNVFSVMDRQQPDFQALDNMAWDWFLKFVDERRNYSKDAAMLYEQLLRLREDGCTLLETDKEALQKWGKGFVKTHRTSPEVTMQRGIEFLDTYEELKQAENVGSPDKLLERLDRMVELTAEPFGGESSLPTKVLEIRKAMNWLQSSRPLMTQFDQAIQEQDHVLAGSIFASLAETAKECPQVIPLEEIMEPMREKVQVLQAMDALSRVAIQFDQAIEQHDSALASIIVISVQEMANEWPQTFPVNKLIEQMNEAVGSLNEIPGSNKHQKSPVGKGPNATEPCTDKINEHE